MLLLTLVCLFTLFSWIRAKARQTGAIILNRLNGRYNRIGKTAAPGSNRQCGRLENGPQGERALHLRNSGQARQILAVDARKILGVFGDHLQDIIRRPGHQVALQNVWNPPDRPLEGLEHLLGLTLQCDFDEYGCRHPQFARIQQRDIVPDIAFRLKPLDPAVVSGKRKAILKVIADLKTKEEEKKKKPASSGQADGQGGGGSSGPPAGGSGRQA